MRRPRAVFAPAKINLYLHVTGQRPDGYHQLDSLVVFADYGDEISVAPAAQLSLRIDGPYAAGLTSGEDNLVIKAARKLAELTGIKAGAAIHLTKNLPLASGIGGGSADAAATLRALAELWQISLPPEELLGLAATLGADVPVCLTGAPSFMSGIGEQITAAPALPPCWLVLLNPNTPVSTPAVFAARQGDFSTPAPFEMPPQTTAKLAALLTQRRNDLTAAAITAAPVISEVLAALKAMPGQRLTRLSGSGATCFALFDDENSAAAAAETLKNAQPTWWVKAAALRS